MKEIFKILFILIFVVSCSKNEQKTEEISSLKADSLLNEENLNHLRNYIDFMEYFTMFKKFDAKYYDLVAKPEQYDKISGRRELIIRFGMLCSDIAYMKIVGEKTQIYEYEKLFNEFVKELNLTEIFNPPVAEYIEIIKNNDLNDSLFDVLRTKFKKDRAELVDKLKDIDEEFLIYFTYGVELEQWYLTKSISKYHNDGIYLPAPIDTNHNINLKVIEYLKNDKETFSKLFNNIWNYKSDDPKIIEYQTYTSKLKPIYVILNKRVAESSPLTEEEVLFIRKIVIDLRKELLN